MEVKQRFILKRAEPTSEPYYGCEGWGADIRTAGAFESRAHMEEARGRLQRLGNRMLVVPVKPSAARRRLDEMRERLAKALGVLVRSEPDTEWAHLIATASEMTKRLNDVDRVPGEIAVNHIRREVALRTVHEMNRRARRGAHALRETLQVDIREGKWKP